MNKALQFGLSAIANFLPGLKTYSTLIIAGAMAICEALGFHSFDGSVWTTVGVTGATFAKMGMDRENPNHPIGTPTVNRVVNRVVNSLGKKPRKK